MSITEDDYMAIADLARIRESRSILRHCNFTAKVREAYTLLTAVAEELETRVNRIVFVDEPEESP